MPRPAQGRGRQQGVCPAPPRVLALFKHSLTFERAVTHPQENADPNSMPLWAQLAPQQDHEGERSAKKRIKKAKKVNRPVAYAERRAGRAAAGKDVAWDAARAHGPRGGQRVAACGQAAEARRRRQRPAIARDWRGAGAPGEGGHGRMEWRQRAGGYLMARSCTCGAIGHVAAMRYRRRSRRSRSGSAPLRSARRRRRRAARRVLAQTSLAPPTRRSLPDASPPGTPNPEGVLALDQKRAVDKLADALGANVAISRGDSSEDDDDED